MSNIGFVKIHRKMLDWEWYNDIPVKILFLHFLLKTNHQTKKWQGIVINRGELLTGRFELAKDTGLSQQQVRTAINKLKSTGEITIKSTNKFTIIKLVNYGVYQDKKDDSSQQPNQEATNNQPTSNQPATNNQPQLKNEKNYKKDKNKTPPLPPSENPPPESSCDDFHYQCAWRIGNSVFKRKKIHITEEKIKKWAGDIKLLEKHDLKHRRSAFEDIKKAIETLENFGDERYFPVIESGFAFRKKFIAIEDFLIRQERSPSYKQDDMEHRLERQKLSEYYAALEQQEQKLLTQSKKNEL